MEQYILITTLVVALVELVKRAEAKDYRTCAIIIGAGLIGGIVGFLRVQGITIEDGIVVGLGASGFVTVATRLGGTK